MDRRHRGAVLTAAPPRSPQEQPSKGFRTAAALAGLLILQSGCAWWKPAPAPAPPPTAPLPALTFPQQGTIYFLKGDASLSPGAVDKLQKWVQTWGPGGSWRLDCPSEPMLTYDVLARRIRALRTELERHGVSRLETRLVPREAPGPYEAIHVVKQKP